MYSILKKKRCLLVHTLIRNRDFDTGNGNERFPIPEFNSMQERHKVFTLYE